MNREARTILMAAGGTGGHIYPALAVARAWLKRHPGDRMVFAGTHYGMETKIIPREGFELRALSSRGVAGKSPVALLKGLWGAAKAMRESARLVKELRPVLVLGTGGYASFAPMRAAMKRGIPTLALEVNRRPGLANRMLRSRVSAMAVAFEETLAEAGPHGVWTGTPLRVFESKSREHGRFGVFVFGGSQGSLELNRLMREALPLLEEKREKFFVIHMRGAGKDADLEEAYPRHGVEARVMEYVLDMAWAYAQADVVVCRAGAITLAELALLGKPSVLVPLASSAGGHQAENARAFERAGAALMFDGSAPEASEKLASALMELSADAPRLSAMGAATKGLGRNDAAERICELMEKILEKGHA
jgi:UDP-N-acetylglucosamine--N-acetylmuramyl-(pentapeptide) pyrophosphoryl-undecaprenol N-acetylglucosamine transferase